MIVLFLTFENCNTIIIIKDLPKLCNILVFCKFTAQTFSDQFSFILFWNTFTRSVQIIESFGFCIELYSDIINDGKQGSYGLNKWELMWVLTRAKPEVDQLLIRSCSSNNCSLTSCIEFKRWFISLMHIWTSARTVRRRDNSPTATRQFTKWQQTAFKQSSNSRAFYLQLDASCIRKCT